MIRFSTISFVMFFTLAFGMVATADQEAAKKAALNSAKTWLQLIDDGKYSEGWEQTSAFFKTAVKLERLGTDDACL